MSEKDSSEKKRRKALSSESCNKQLKEDFYESIIFHEEQEAKRRSSEKDMILFHKTCSDLRNFFEDISALKKENTDKAKQEIHEKRIQGSLIFVALKKLNRLDKIRIRAGRDALHKEKLRVDSNRLQLQNLLYEANHLKREVQRCYLFKSQDEEIDLVTEEEFYKDAPEVISRPNKTSSDDHARRLARLEWELQQRKELSSLCKELSVSKQNASKDIASKTERLSSLTPCLEALLKATKPLQQALSMDVDKDWEIQKSARLLPRPLYLVYANLSAYAEACDKTIKITIEGDEDEAKQVVEGDKNDLQDDDDNQESDNDDNEPESRKKHHKRQSKTDLLELKRKNLLRAHPLSVIFNVYSSDSTFISITLRHFPVLGFVTVKPQTSIDITGIAAGDVISPENILNCLYPEDFGEMSPNPKTSYQLLDYGMTTDELFSLLSEQNAGKPYMWAQKLCGLDFVLPQQSMAASFRERISHEVSQHCVPNIIKLIKSRWQYRLTLFEQIHCLENKKVDLYSNMNLKNSVRISSTLVQWTSIVFDEYSANQVTQKLVEGNLVSMYDLFYRAVVIRGSAKLECLICVSSDFPIANPFWSLFLSWNGKHDAGTSAAIREMEYWINILPTEKNSSSILATQLTRAMSTLDVLLETEGPLYSPAEFSQDKTFLKAFRGRQRARPYKIIQNGGNVIYKQI